MVAVGLLCGAVPARHAASIDLRSALAAGSQNVASEPRTMRVTVGVEVALGVILPRRRRIADRDPGGRADRPRQRSAEVRRAGVLLLMAAIAAAWGPAHRATRVDPLATLRAQ
jgi:hypothetical protein